MQDSKAIGLDVGEDTRTEKEILFDMAKRLNTFSGAEGNKLYISSYYEVTVTFNDEGQVIDISTRP